MRPETPAVTFFVDRCLGADVVPNGLRAAGAVVEVHDDHFAQNCKDPEWIPVVARNGWIVLTKDKRIRRRRIEIEVFRRAEAGAFYLTNTKNLTDAEMAASFVRALPRMAAIAAKYRRPFIAKVTADGAVVVIEGARRGGRPRERQ